jgi:hypothetical protein
MPDFQNFSITPQSAANINMPRFLIEVQITDSMTGELLHDFTGANAIRWPADVPILYSTAEERREFVRELARMLIEKKVEVQNG